MKTSAQATFLSISYHQVRQKPGQFESKLVSLNKSVLVKEGRKEGEKKVRVSLPIIDYLTQFSWQVKLIINWWTWKAGVHFSVFFLSSCWSTRDLIVRSTRNSNPVMTSSAGGVKGCSDHRFRAPPATTASAQSQQTLSTQATLEQSHI